MGNGRQRILERKEPMADIGLIEREGQVQRTAVGALHLLLGS